MAYQERTCSVEFGILPLIAMLLRGQREKCRDGEQLGLSIGRHWSLKILHSTLSENNYTKKTSNERTDNPNNRLLLRRMFELDVNLYIFMQCTYAMYVFLLEEAVFLLLVYVFLSLSMYSYCCLWYS